MRAGQALDVFVAQHPIERSARAAIGIGNEDVVVGLAPRGDCALHRTGDAVRGVVQAGWQADQIDMVEPRTLGDRADFAGQRPAGDHQNAVRRQPAAIWFDRRAMKALAVSTATAASRQ